MSKKEEILRYAEEQKRLEAERRSGGNDGRPVRVRASGMPLGCWLWAIGIIMAIIFGIKKLLG